MKRRALRPALVGPFALLFLAGSVSGWTVYRELRQNSLNRALVDAIATHHTANALDALQKGANPNTRAMAQAPTSLREWLIRFFRPQAQPPGWTPSALWIAVEQGDAAVTEALLKRGVQPGQTDSEGRVILLFAVEKNNTAIIDALLLHGAPGLNACDKEGNPLALLALKMGNQPVVESLLAHGADPARQDAEKKDLLGLACEKGKLALVRRIVGEGYRLPVTGDASFPLSLAAGEGHLDIVQFLLSKGARIDDRIVRGEGPASGESFLPALQTASDKGHTEIVKLLIKRGASINYDYGRGTALALAAGSNHLGTVRALLAAGADVNAYTNRDRLRPINCASQSGCFTAMRMLADAGAEVNGTYGFQNSTPLCDAAEMGKANDVRCLLKHGAKVDKVGRPEKGTPLYYAARRGEAEIVRVLLEHGANPNVVALERDLAPKQWTPLSAAKRYESAEVVQFLKQAGARE